MKIDAAGVRPEVIAAIMAAVYTMMGSEKNLAVTIRRSSDVWQIAGRQKLMDSRQS